MMWERFKIVVVERGVSREEMSVPDVACAVGYASSAVLINDDAVYCVIDNKSGLVLARYEVRQHKLVSYNE